MKHGPLLLIIKTMQNLSVQDKIWISNSIVNNEQLI